MTKAVSNREICFIKVVLLLCEHGHFKKKSKWCFYHPPILLGLNVQNTEIQKNLIDKRTTDKEDAKM